MNVSVFADPWCEVWLDGTRVATETPAHFQAPRGDHELRFVNAKWGLDLHQRESLGADVGFVVDVKKGTVERR